MSVPYGMDMFFMEVKMVNCACLIMAAGKGSRMKSDVKKQFLKLNGVPILAITISKFDMCDKVDMIVIVAPKDDIKTCSDLCKEYCKKTAYSVIEGGKERYNSVYNGIKFLEGKCRYVMIQDGVRPFVTEEIITKTLKSAEKYGACIPVVDVKDTIKEVDSNGMVTKTLKRSSLCAVQTPQAFEYNLIKKAYENLPPDLDVTDDASVVEISGGNVKIVEGSYDNIKITTIEDLDSGLAILKKEKANEIS